ncbi:hypothetical protein CYMTET_13660 [Cymbomonas tetramitiformis]|uniref:Uncharacterized protein n=1 Tax=Cymbomonas tetramitiformis TaxID=36881 RepID=A0AAE0FVT4_9CHLO|nr:hypothetical protein CYMTET_24466 [Cymbomonas tetramitiformis]KAK3278397.1 hypothetical protein CYMTET_13660 [Cymbomonas tetramitiformis]
MEVDVVAPPQKAAGEGAGEEAGEAAVAAGGAEGGGGEKEAAGEAAGGQQDVPRKEAAAGPAHPGLHYPEDWAMQLEHLEFFVAHLADHVKLEALNEEFHHGYLTKNVVRNFMNFSDKGVDGGVNHHRRKDADLLEGELKPVYGTAAATASASKQVKGTSAKAVAGQAAPATARAVNVHYPRLGTSRCT